MKRKETFGISLTFNILVVLSQIVFASSEIFEKDLLVVDVLCDSASVDLGTARSVTSCAQNCVTQPTCKSFFFVKTNKQCKGVSTILGSTVGCISMSSSVYYKTTPFSSTTTTTTTTTTSTSTTTTPTTTTTTTAPAENYGSACFSEADCTMDTTHCLQGSCQCIAGYSYESTTGHCVEACDSYGTTYTHFPHMALDVSSIAQYSSVSITECKASCSSLMSCRGFNFCSICGNLCRLKK